MKNEQEMSWYDFENKFIKAKTKFFSDRGKISYGRPQRFIGRKQTEYGKLLKARKHSK